jgi:hypothetical protein
MSEAGRLIMRRMFEDGRATLNRTEVFELDNIVCCLHSLVSEYTPRLL